MDFRLFLSTFGLVFLAELPDKTALTVLVMSARENPPAVFTGAAAAFVVQSAVAILFGSLLSLLPPAFVHRLAGFLFWVFAVMMVIKKEKKNDDATLIPVVPAFWKSVWSAFVIIFLMEWGDLSQLATATLVAKYREPVTIFFASVLALWVVTALSAALGHGVRQKLHPEKLRYVAAAAFAVIGTFLFFRP